MTSPGAPAPARWRRLPIFIAVGLVATMVHGVVAWIVLGFAGGLVANAAGFLVALAVTYLGNYFVTFRSSATHGDTLIRFLAVSAATLAFSEWVFFALHAMGARERTAVIVAVAVIPLLRFGILARHVFHPAGTVVPPLREWLIGLGVWLGGAGLGIAALAAMAPSGLLDAQSEVWRFPGGDRGIAVSGMRYYLHDDWHWPLLLTDDLAIPDGTVIAFTDSLPLFALAAKVARPVLGPDVNYFPTWFLVVYTLQGVAAMTLLRSLGIRRPVPLLGGAALSVMFPAFILRAAHPALSGHFVILFILAAAFGSGRAGPTGRGPRLATVALLPVALLIHPYLLFMTAPLVAAIYLDHGRHGRLNRSQLALAGVSAAGAVGVTMVVCGYLGGYAGSDHYGLFGMNLLNPLYPQWSGLVPGEQPFLGQGESDWEGFNWLGFGALGLVAVALATERRRLGPLVSHHAVLVVAAIVLAAVAITPTVAVGSSLVIPLGAHLITLTHHPLSRIILALVIVGSGVILVRHRRLVTDREHLARPRPALVLGVAALAVVTTLRLLASDRINDHLGLIRASGRLFWPLGLVAGLVAIALISQSALLGQSGPRAQAGLPGQSRVPGRFHPWLVPAIIALAVVVQAIDTQPLRHEARRLSGVDPTMAGVETLASAAGTAQQVQVRPPFFCAPYEAIFIVLDTIVVAAAAGPTPIDTAYTARRPVDLTCAVAADPATANPVLGPDDLIVLALPNQRDPGALIGPEHHCRDNGIVLACTRQWAGLAPGDTAPFLPVVAEPVTFGQGGDADWVMTEGWGEPEIWGRVVPTSGAGVQAALVGPVEGPLAVRMRLRAPAGGAGTLVITDHDGTEHRVLVEPGDPRSVMVTLSPIGTQARFRLATESGGDPVGIDELTIMAAG